MSNGAYAAAYEQSISDPSAFWGKAAESIEWITPPEKVLDDSNPPFYRWFAGGTLNTCFNALDRHVRDGRGGQIALFYDSPVTGYRSEYTYGELLEQVWRFAGGLRNLGIEKGDRVVIYMPMVPEAVIAMLACARLGAIHSVVFGGFAPAELSARIEDAAPKVVVSASCGIEPNRTIPYKPMLDAGIERSTHKPERVVMLQRPQAEAEMTARDIDWNELMAGADPVDCVEVAATDPLYILYTSGTTGRPKGIVRDNGGHAVALRWSMENVYDVKPGEVWFTASDVGWVVGHSYIVYAPLLTGATTILYEGKPVGTPDAGAFWRIIAEYGAVAMFTAPTAYRAIKRDDPKAALLEGHDISHLRNVFLAGSTRTPTTGPTTCCTARSSTTGGRPRPAGRSRPTCAVWTRCRSSPGPHRCECRGMTCKSSTSTARTPRAARTAPSRSSCRCRPARCPRCGRTTSGMSRAICRPTPAITSPATAA